MFCFWTYLSLFFVLQHSVSADEGVSLNCNRTVEVTSGANVTLNCDINWKDCKNISGKFIWKEANDNNLCDLEGNICKSDGQTNGSLTILNIQENKNITAEVSAACGIDGSLIRVLVYERTQDPDQHTDVNNGKEEEEKNGSSTLTAGLLAGVSAAIIVIMVIFFVWFKIKQRISLHRRSQQDTLD